LISCSKNEDTPVVNTNPDPEPVAEDSIFSVNRENQYALNVVFFKPSDYSSNPTLLNNISDMMLFMQKWYEKQMELQGFGKKTFGLMTKNGKVNVILIEAPEASSYYDTNAKIRSEIDKHFSEFPEDKQSEHTLVLGQKGSGVPFYGLGKWCFATSDGSFELTKTGKFIGDLELLTTDKLGGILHELGHGINLPHNCHKASDLPNNALMSFGNHTYQKDPSLVYLTKASCAILNTSQTFNTKDNSYYDSGLLPNLKSYSVSKDDTKKAIIIQGLVSSNLNMTDFYVGHDGLPAGGNNGYDKITWSDKLVPTENPDEYSFYEEMPYSDIFNGYKRKDSLALTLDVIAKNGTRKEVLNYIYTMNESTQVPNDDILKNYEANTYSNRSGWTVSTNTTASGSDSKYMIDGNDSTYWHCYWPYSIASNGNHVITVNMGETKEIKGVYWFSYRSENKQFRPKHVIIESSTDNATWNAVKDVTIDSIDNAKEATVNFDSPITTQYFRLTIDQVYSENTTDNLIMTELDIL
jgi:hypothetical protein